ncbi:hypothetical protein [Aeromonas veronii]|uniref:hypothetical protein n=1 Tax=Aeromonas veronii TaxID=654 RepID=UPI003D21044A
MAIGGYNQLAINNFNSGMELDSQAYKFQSARAALYAYCKTLNIKVLYLPNYICDSIFPALKSLNIKLEIYTLNELLLPEMLPVIKDVSNSRILIVNYFGLLSEQIKNIICSSPQKFIIDNSQALFSEHIDGTTSIYSPRKFLGIPDGGLLRSSEEINMPNTVHDASENVAHLLLRAAGDVNSGYKYFLAAERALDDFLPKRISIISTYLIKCENLSEVKNIRRRNYNLLHAKFKSLNRLQFPINEHVPLCYPLKLDFNVANICTNLLDSSIYLPRYWRSNYCGKVGQSMFDNTLFLPIDQRLTEDSIRVLSDIVEERIKYECKR